MFDFVVQFLKVWFVYFFLINKIMYIIFYWLNRYLKYEIIESLRYHIINKKNYSYFS